MTTNDFIRMQCIFCNNYKFINLKIDKEPEYYECKSCEYLHSIDFDNEYLRSIDFNNYKENINLSGLGVSLEKLYYYSKNDINKIDIGDNLELNKIKSSYNYQLKFIKENINKQRNNFNNYIRYNMFKIKNCINCRIAIKDKSYFEQQNDYAPLKLCYECHKNRKDLFVLTTDAKKKYFLNTDDLKNIRYNLHNYRYKIRYKLYYVGDLIKKRNEKYDNSTIEQLIIKSKKHDILKQEKKKNKKLLIESRKNDIIKEIKNIGLHNEDINFNNKNIKKYLHTGDNLNSVIEMLIEDRFLETKTNYFAYLFTYGYFECVFNNDILDYICIKLENITLDKKSNDILDFKVKNLWPFYYSYILKRFSKIEQSRIMEKIYNNDIRTKEDLEDFEVLKIKVEYYAIKEFNIYNIDNKYELPPRFANLSDETIDKNCTEPIYKLSDDIYNIHYENLIKSVPDFETNVTKMLNKYKDSSNELKLDNKNDIIEPIEMKLVKKNDKNYNKNDDIVIVD